MYTYMSLSLDRKNIEGLVYMYIRSWMSNNGMRKTG